MEISNNKMNDWKIKYEKRLKRHIKQLFIADVNTDMLSDILLDKFIEKNKDTLEKSKKLKQIQMKIGMIWQYAIGHYKDFKDLGVGHYTGLDVMSKNRKIIIELKNRYNTDNASARKSNYNKLAEFKLGNPEYVCIYGIINDKTKDGRCEHMTHNDQDIMLYSGDELLNYIFGNDKEYIIKLLHNIIDTYI